MKKIYILIVCSLLATALHAQKSFGTYLQDVIQKQEKGMLVTAKLIEACGLCETLDILEDYEYLNRYMRGEIPQSFLGNNDSFLDTFYSPDHRRYGYTLFAETDDFWEQQISKNYKNITVNDVKEFVVNNGLYPSAADNDRFEEEDNVLNQFVTYHLLNRRLSPNCLVNHYNEQGYNPKTGVPTIPICEYYTTMGARRLLRVYESKESKGIYLNRFPVLDNGRWGTYHELSCDDDKKGIYIDTEHAIKDIINAIIYPIGDILAFDEKTAQNMGSIRLRMDVASFFPEMATNDIRLSKSAESRHKNVYLPCDVYPYLDDLIVNNQETKFCYWTGYNENWSNMQGDEFNCRGLTDITLRLPPVPTKTEYELRVAILSGSNSRGIFQIYFGTHPDNLSPIGMPVDFRQGAYYIITRSGNLPSYIGYENDTQDDVYDQMRDNELHENGFMKGCLQYSAGAPGSSTMMRSQQHCLRRILGKKMMDPDKTYYLRFKNVLDNPNTSFYLDYIEFCPKKVYDNPEKPEDIW